jgi:hypothetical protein
MLFHPAMRHLHIRLLTWAVFSLWISTSGCMHTIHVHPLPSGPTANKIPRSVQLVTGPIIKIGADHMPGITQLRWPKDDVKRALLEYVQRRESFTAVSTAPADLTMLIGTELSLKSRDRYWYRIRLQIEMKETTRLIKSYAAEQEVEGSFVRWVTASDRDPIETALQRVLDDVFTQIEADRSLYVPATGRTSK